MAAGFVFTADSFKFYYYYGACERFAEGSFAVNKDTIVLKSNKTPGDDFTIVKQSTTAGRFVIKVIDPNRYITQYVSCFVITGEKTEQFSADHNGIIVFDAEQNSTVYVRHELFPDIPTLIKDEHNASNYFEVTLKQSLEQLSFKGIELFIKGDVLTWHPNYFIGEENVRFEKEKD